MPREHVIYTRTWFRQSAACFGRDILRSIAFGLIMFLGFVLVIFLPLLALQAEPETESKGTAFLVFFLGCPAAVFCWWLALKVAEEPVNVDYPSIWDDQPVRWLESTVRFAHYLESQGKHIDMGLVLADDVRAEAHRLIEQTDEQMVRAFMAAWLAASSTRSRTGCDAPNTPRLLNQ